MVKKVFTIKTDIVKEELGMIPLVNCVGGIVLLLFFVMDENSHVNAYDDVPTNMVE